MKLEHEIKIYLLPLLLLAVVSPAYSEIKNTESSQSEVVWHWTDDKHAEKTIIFETTVDGEVVSIAKFPVRRDMRSEIKPEQKQKTIKYNFTLHKKKGRNFRGVSYGKVEGNIWGVGWEGDGLIFGISWVIENKIILHELSPVFIDKTETIKIADGVYFKTYWSSK